MSWSSRAAAAAATETPRKARPQCLRGVCLRNRNVRRARAGAGRPLDPLPDRRSAPGACASAARDSIHAPEARARRHRAPSSLPCGPLPASFSSSSLSSSSSSSSGDGGGAASPRAAAASASARRCCSRRPSVPGWCARLCARTRGRAPVRLRAPVDAAREHLLVPAQPPPRLALWGGGGARTRLRADGAASDARLTGPGTRGRACRGGPDREHLEPTGAHRSSPPRPPSRSRTGTAPPPPSVRRFFPALGRRASRAPFFERRTFRHARRPEGVPPRSPVSPRGGGGAWNTAPEPSTPSSPAYPSAREESRLSRPRPPAAHRRRGWGQERVRPRRRRTRRRGSRWPEAALRGPPSAAPAGRAARRITPSAPADSRSRERRGANPTPRRRPPPRRARASDAARRGRSAAASSVGGVATGRLRSTASCVGVAPTPRTCREHVEALGGSKAST